MPIVYVPQYPQRSSTGWQPNMASATNYGELHYLFDADEQFIGHMNSCIQKGMRTLKNFKPEEDYVVFPPSSPIALIIIIMCLVYHGHEEINFLYWDRIKNDQNERVSGHYIPVKISLIEAKESMI